MTPELIGKALNRYQITELLEEGGLGFVFKGVDSRSQRVVAIRVMPEDFTNQPHFEERFLISARTAARMDHPGVVKVFDYGKYEDYLYLVMEPLAGESLAQKLEGARAKREWLPLTELIQIARQIALAVDYANQQGILHIDVHPSKILLKPGGEGTQPVTTDLGLAWLESGLNSAPGSTPVWSPAYLSPEQARGAPLDTRSDVYSFGILLYELATAKPPFPAKTFAEAVEYHREEQTPPPRLKRPTLPENLEQVILKSLQKDPNKRFADMKALTQALEQVATWIAQNPPSRPIETSRPRTGPPRPEPAIKQPAPSNSDYLLVESPNKPSVTIPVTKAEMSIGRGKDADIPLNSLGVSRDHAKLSFDGREYYLIDLDSTNGTFLDDGKLLPGVRDLWSSNKVARIGTFTIKLVRAGKSAPLVSPGDRPITQIYRRDGSLAEQKHIHVSSGEGRIGAFLEEDDLEVAAGESVGMTIVLRNQGETVDHFRVTIEGVPASWVTIQPPTVFLMPENQETIQATFKPPRASTSKAGIYDLVIRVSSTEAPDQEVEVIATLTVQSFVEYHSELHPEKIDTNQKARITIRNQGNNTETFVLTLKDRADELKFTPPQAQIQIPEGQPGAIEFYAGTRRPRVMRKPVTHAYTAELGVASGGDKRTYSGEIVSNGFIPVWLLPLLLLLCVALALAVPLGMKAYSALTQPTPTPSPVPVAVGSPTLPFSVAPIGTAGTPALVLTATPDYTPTPTPFCPGAPPPRLEKGGRGKVSTGIRPDENLKVHQTAEYVEGNVIGRMPIGTQFQILSDPICVPIEDTTKSAIMWQIQVDKSALKFSDGSSKGWVVEGDNLNYYTDPLK
jgi:serine/threonine protein kinase